MKREVSVSVIAVLVVTAAILSVYYLNLKTTGFAVFEQNAESAFNEGTYSNVLYDSNASAVILDSGSNASSGTYTSKVFDSANNATTWNNLTWQGTNVTFEVRGCTDSNCSTENFTTPGNLNNLSFVGQYLQYKALFDSSNDSLTSVIIDYSVPVVTSVTVSQPSGTIDTWEGIGLQYSASGTGLQCWYNVKDSDSVDVVANTTPAACANTTFNVGDDGDGSYTVTVFANGTSGFALHTLSFTIDTSFEGEEEQEEKVEEEAPVEEVPEIQLEQQPTVALTIGNLEVQEIIQGNSKSLTLALQNTGTAGLTGCRLIGDDSGWLEVSAEGMGIAAGTSASPAFTVSVPEKTLMGTYTLSLTIECAEATGTRSITVNVLQKKIDFNITNVQRTRDNRVSVDYALTELAGEDQDLEIYFSIKDSAGAEIANASQNRSIDANETDDFRTNLAINETLNGTMILSATFNSQIYSSSVLEPITLGAPTGAAIFGGIGAGSFVIVIAVALILATVFFAARRMRQSGKILRNLSGKASKDD